MKVLKTVGFLGLCSLSFNGISQELNADMQIRPRFEYRNGFKSLMKDNDKSTAFVSQRTRLNLNFTQDKLSTKLSLQNVRVWGDVPTTTQADKNGIAVYEAWANYNLTPKISAKVGRQALSYNNQRILGGIDWIQQGQSHDAFLFIFKDSKQKLDLGGALNSNAENLVQTNYTVSNYKTMQFGHYSRQVKKLNLSLLFMNVGYEYLNANNKIAIDYNQTFGTVLTFKHNKFEANVNAYGQSGKRNDLNITASNIDLNLSYAFLNRWKVSVGHEYLSGKSQDDTTARLKSFTPLFGTNHAHNGLMDYFYVGNHMNSVGLHDSYFKLNYNHEKWQFALVPHVFHSPTNVLDSNGAVMNNYLGTEFDFTFEYKLQKDISISAGYSQMFGSRTLESLKGGNYASTNNWAWLMININPRIFTTKKAE